jgi:hypothetical protein
MDLWAYQHAVRMAFSRPGKPTDRHLTEIFKLHKNICDRHLLSEEISEILNVLILLNRIHLGRIWPQLSSLLAPPNVLQLFFFCPNQKNARMRAASRVSRRGTHNPSALWIHDLP